MSINSMTNDELRRNPEFQQRAVEKMREPTKAATEAAIQENAANNTINMLAGYIPTEAVTLYVAAVSITSALQAMFSFMDAKFLYWLFVILTPFLVLLIQYSKLAMSNMSFPRIQNWPWWKMIAATVAFLVWALAVPNNPYVHGDSGSVVAGFGALLISTFLSLLDPIAKKIFRM